MFFVFLFLHLLRFWNPKNHWFSFSSSSIQLHISHRVFICFVFFVKINWIWLSFDWGERIHGAGVSSIHFSSFFSTLNQIFLVTVQFFFLLRYQVIMQLDLDSFPRSFVRNVKKKPFNEPHAIYESMKIKWYQSKNPAGLSTINNFTFIWIQIHSFIYFWFVHDFIGMSNQNVHQISSIINKILYSDKYAYHILTLWYSPVLCFIRNGFSYFSIQRILCIVDE